MEALHEVLKAIRELKAKPQGVFYTQAIVDIEILILDYMANWQNNALRNEVFKNV